MSEAIIFEYPYDLFLKQRLEFVVICQDHLEASIMRMIEYKMIKLKEAWQDKVEQATEAKKTPPKEPKVYWVRLSHSQIIARLYLYDSAKLEKPKDEDMESEAWVEYRRKKALSISKSTLRKAIDALIEKGLLVMRSKPGDEFGAPIYTLNQAKVQAALKALPANPFTIFHMGGVSNFESGGELENLELPPTEVESGDVENLEVGLTENEDPQLENFNINIDMGIDTTEIEIDSEKESTVTAASASVTTAPTSLLEYKQRKTDPALPVVNTHNQTTQSLHIATLATVTTDASKPDVTTPLDGDVAPVDYMTDPLSDFDDSPTERLTVPKFSQQGVPSHDDTPLSVASGLPARADTPSLVPGDGLPGCDGVQRSLQAESHTEVSTQEITSEQKPDLQASHVSRPLAIPPGESASLLLQSSVARGSLQQTPSLPTGTDVPPSVQSPGDAAPRTAYPPDGSPVSSGTVQTSGAKKRRNPIPERPKDKKVIQMLPPEPELSPEEMEIYTAWCSLFHVEVPLTKAIIQSCRQLNKPVRVWAGLLNWTLVDVLKDNKDSLYENDKNGYYKRGVKLYDVAREFEGWASKQERKLEQKKKQEEAASTTPGTVTGMYRNKTEELRQQRERYAAQGGGH